MSIFFHPNNPQYRRGVKLLCIGLTSFAAFNVIIADFGPHEHVFSSVHRYLFPKIDRLLNITQDDIDRENQRYAMFEKDTSVIFPAGDKNANAVAKSEAKRHPPS